MLVQPFLSSRHLFVRGKDERSPRVPPPPHTLRILLPLTASTQSRPTHIMSELKVIGCGLPRTGTNSLQTALQILGFDPCYHMYGESRPPLSSPATFSELYLASSSLR